LHAPLSSNLPPEQDVHKPEESQVEHPVLHNPQNGVNLEESEQVKQFYDVVTQVEHLLSQAWQTPEVKKVPLGHVVHYPKELQVAHPVLHEITQELEPPEQVAHKALLQARQLVPSS